MRFRSMLSASAGLAVAVLGVYPGIASGQETAEATLEVTSTSEEAKAHFWAGLDEVENIFFSRSATRLEQALALDEDFGLARALYGFGAPGLSDEERVSEFNRGLASLVDGSVPEHLLALAWREWSAGNNGSAKAAAEAASKLVPDDPHAAFFSAWFTGLSEGPAKAVEVLEEVVEQFPDNAPAYNFLAYQRWATGDHHGAFSAVRRYVELREDHPNTHDSYAELLQWDGRYGEAMRHYRRALELDESYLQAYAGMAEVHQLMGNGSEARTALSMGVERATTTQGRLNFMRAIAGSHLIDRNRNEAMRLLASVASEAEANDLAPLAALAHREMAVADAMLGNGRSVESHLQRAAEIGEEDTPQQQAWEALAYLSAGEIEAAREPAQQLEEQASGNWQNFSRALNGMIYLQEDQIAEAIEELEQADPENQLVRVVLAECYKEMGRRAEASALRDDVMMDRQLNLFNSVTPFVRLRARKI